MPNFVDRIQIHLKAGKGGDGCASIRREKYKPLAGPNGGNGGTGGSIIIKADSNLTSLLDFHFSRKKVADNGEMGYGGNKDGKDGQDIILPVPVGTQIKSLKGQLVIDLNQDGEEFVAVQGGLGGFGNQKIASKQRKAPGFALLGLPGEETDLIFELKMLADVALVGYPSSGKSSLIAAMSAARPKIADYPFTTLIPNLGVVQSEGLRYTVADVPGLIPGAWEGKGLGHEFLRHIERTKVIVHVIDMATYEPGRDPISDLKAIEEELGKYQEKFGAEFENEDRVPLLDRPNLIVLNKVDNQAARELANFAKEELIVEGYQVLLCSAKTHEGVKEIKSALAKILRSVSAGVPESDNSDENSNEFANESDRVEINITPLKRRVDQKPFTIEKKRDNDGDYWWVEGDKLRKWVLQTDMGNDEAVGYLADKLAKIGVEDVLAKAGAQAGDEVRVSTVNHRVKYLEQETDAFIFDYEPELTAGAEQLYSLRRGEDTRLDYEDRVRRATRKEKREQYHERQDARAAYRERPEADDKTRSQDDTVVGNSDAE
ncbi:MAG: GTPase ObgE [Candidatus Ancillula sp.]|jgi:GTP-binding protein|nr:GTPase ObgE [Candidatus Ancillula sp.]